MIKDVIRVRCPGCGEEQVTELVQSLNTRTDPAAKARLMDGTLNVLDCACGRRSPLAAKFLYYDPDADFYCHVCPDHESIASAEAAFREAGAKGAQRIVPSMNALVEKVKIVDAGLEDWAVELVKVLLLGSLQDPNTNRVLLFDRREKDALCWLAFLDDGPRLMRSKADQYDSVADRPELAPAAGELHIDRAWAVPVVRALVTRDTKS